MFSGLMFKQQEAVTSLDFTFSVKTDNAGTSSSTQFKYPTISGGSYNCVVDWGDGNTSTITTYNDTAWTHTYSSAGTYTIKISGVCTGIFMNGDNLKWLTISNWGIFNPGNSGNWFLNCSNLTITATDVPSFTSVTTFVAAFKGCSAITTIPNIGTWNVSSITVFASMFDGATLFNSSINAWTISSATSLGSMFKNASTYNQSMNSWVLPSSLTTMASMFEGATAFDGNITSWVFLANISLASMFYNASSFNQAIGSWGGLNYVTNVTSLFRDATSFDQSLSSWNLSAVTTTANMFQGASSFNSAIPTFDNSLTNVTSMFRAATSFNQSISSIDTTNVTNFSSMFYEAISFNHSSITTLNTSKGSNFTSMFRGATSFNQNINTSGSYWILNSTYFIFTASMFLDATAFNQDISGWDITTVANTTDMFNGATSFNQNLGAWLPFNLQNATRMFYGVTLSTANYNAFLVTLDNCVSFSDVVFDGGNSKYDSTTGGNDGTYARDDLITIWNWNITDGGPV
jgi:surface protein